MISPRSLLFSAALMAIALALLSWAIMYADSAERDESAEDTVAQEAIVKAKQSLVSEPSNNKSPISKPAATNGGCLTPEQIETHPLFAADYRRLDSVAISGPMIASYRGLSSAELHDLAVQGDSAAMATLGAVSVMKARNMAEDKAVPYLLHEDMSLHTYFNKVPLQPEAIKHLEEAHSWFYRAALHGRLLALGYAGESIGIIKGGPVGLGWVEEDEYEALRGFAKSAFMPMTVYNALAFEIAPQLRDGPSGIIYELLPRNERQETILVELVKQFEKDREEAKLPPIVVAESTAPSMQEIRSMLCESFLDPSQYNEH